MARRGSNEGSIYHRSDGRWTAVVSVGYEGGRRRRKAFYGRTRQEVARKLTTALKAKEDGLGLPQERETVGRFLRSWLESVQPSLRPRTVEAYDLNIRRLIPHIGTIRLARLTPKAVQSCYGDLLTRGLSARSVQQAHAVLHRAMRQAVQWGLLGRNPADAVAPPRPARREMRTLGSVEVQQLFEATAGERLHALWVLLVTTGLRLGEALGLAWEDLDTEAGRLSVTRALQRQRGVGLVFVEPKTARSRRSVLVPASTLAAVREHRTMQLAERLALGPAWEELGLVFCHQHGRPLDPSFVDREFHSALKRAELPRVRVHDLRHTAATLLLERGVHAKIVQDMLGHSTITLTLDLYSHVTPTMQQEAVAQMEAIFATR